MPIDSVSEIAEEITEAAESTVRSEPEAAEPSNEAAEPEAPKQITSTKAHLTNSVPRAAASPRGMMSPSELREARELFRDLTDAQINQLYKKVTQ